MEKVLIGKYFLMFDCENSSFIGKSLIIDHIHGPYYLVKNFDMDNGRTDYQSVVSLENIRDLPLFSSVGEMDRFFNTLTSVEVIREISH